jgi:predicted transposase/invertase (TIGR01784 family)
MKKTVSVGLRKGAFSLLLFFTSTSESRIIPFFHFFNDVLMNIVNNPHDSVFKAAMADLRVAKEFFATHLPHTVLITIDLNTLKLQPNSYVDQSLKTGASDVLYKVNLKNGATAFLYLLCEQQSTVDPLMPFRVWQYIINIWADYLKSIKSNKVQLPLVYPVVFYTGTCAYSASNDIRDLIQAPKELIDEVLFERTFQFINVNQLDEEALKTQPWAGMLALMMKHVRDRDIAQFLRQIMGLLQALEQAQGTDYVVLLLNYCLKSGETRNIEEFVDTVKRGLSTEIGAKVMTIAQQFIEKGRVEGEAVGIAKGELMARRKLAQVALAENLPLVMIQKITHLTLEELKALQENTRH